MAIGFTVSKPFGDSAKYDFVVDGGGGLKRVQVKSAWVKTRSNGYQFGASPAQLAGQRSRPYRTSEFEFLIAYIAPEDVWFIIPIRHLLHRNHLHLRTDHRTRFAVYREAWALLLGKKSGSSRRSRSLR